VTATLVEIHGVDSEGTHWAARVPEGSPEAARLTRLAERTSARRRDRRRLAEILGVPAHAAEAREILDRLNRPALLRNTQLHSLKGPTP
jgi:hypothetical protein